MGQALAVEELQVTASDVTGQRSRQVRVSPEATVGEWMGSLVGGLGLKTRDTMGNPYAYRPRLEREGRHLNAGEIIGEVLRDGDQVVLHPNVNAG